MIRYKVFYTITRNHVTYQVDTMIPANKGILDILEGFWVDAKGAYANVSDSKFFVPASRIDYIEKVTHEN